MNFIRTALIGTLLLGTSASGAVAHTGDHTTYEFMGGVAHFLSEPDHILGLAAVVLAVAAVALWKRRRTASVTRATLIDKR